MPDVTGMPAMDALALLENMGLKVKLIGSGKVISQSIQRGIKVKKESNRSTRTIVTELKHILYKVKPETQ